MGHASTCRIHRIHGLPSTSFASMVHNQIRIIDHLIKLFRYDLIFTYKWTENTCVITLTGYDTQNQPISLIYTFCELLPVLLQSMEFHALTQCMLQQTRILTEDSESD